MATGYLLDTMVISELAKRGPDPRVTAWLERTPDDSMYLSVVTIGEIERGIRKARAEGLARVDDLERWRDELAEQFGARILGVDLATARLWGRLTFELGNASADLLIAATALRHELTVATRNTRHFAKTGAPLLDPWR